VYTAPSSHRRRLFASVRLKFVRWLIRIAEKYEENFVRRIQIVRSPDDEDDILRVALAKFDTGCRDDWISLPMAARLSGEDYSKRGRKLVATQQTTEAKLEIYSYGTIELRWSARNTFKAKHYGPDVFQVVNITDYDVVIGMRSIEKYQLAKLNIPNYGGYRPAIDTRRLELLFHRLNFTDDINAATKAAETLEKATVKRENADQARQRYEMQSVS
jgi:hypothetical protein